MHVSFGGCGFLLAFHVGVAKQLQKLGHLTPASSVAGASGGALVAAALACDVPLDAVEERLRQSALAMRSPNRHQSLRDDVRGHILELFPSPLPSHLPLTVATTQVWPRPGVDLHTTFGSRDDLAEALLASCHIPFYLSRDLSVPHRGAWHIDGCVVSLVPTLDHHVVRL
ncbi:hypothetical protein SPRG_19013 [Saprolegnia parasitica CBS 223.65]|uniref:PNPLA domain-containing protein n=1 Tax=Saprolegnia parasitica (strain CBS 223.65) TaxID=695850 RepID=A0A067D658_SAPPC|nr:hypothetical protein SPRG_19013 [Saprolegnia parasitica CBS 223.65]KDO34161.1 hypothetical protein SPRG_19013 [Saprolegnia parasitica CBS 223.65]|eukprot:XP_012195212.1 hypothetical protein SPRG_19013 [Saprolegnia parasitica CBS 223.65]